MKQIVLTTDLSEESKRAFAPTGELARKLGLGVTVLHVVKDLQIAPHGAPLAPAVSSPDLDREAETIRPLVKEMCALLEDGVDVTSEVLVSTDVAREVANYAHQHDALIALSTHGRSGLRKLVLGSMAEAILQKARTPVLCFPLKGTQ
jgi:nucleotide-binding universal stress UspA family protein